MILHGARPELPANGHMDGNIPHHGPYNRVIMLSVPAHLKPTRLNVGYTTALLPAAGAPRRCLLILMVRVDP